MTRTLDALDTAFNILDGQFRPLRDTTIPGHTTDIGTIQAQLGGLPPKPGAGQTVSERLDAIDAKLVSMSDKIKLDREIFLGYAIAGTVIKVDVQAIKVDLTLFKKIDEKNVWLLKKPIAALQKGFTALTSRGEGSVYRWAKELIKKEAKAERLRQEAEAKEKKRKEDELQESIKKLPDKVKRNSDDIDKILRTLRSAGDKAREARNDRTGLPKNHAGVDAADPRIKPVAKDVKNLRSAVDELITSLGAL